MKKTLAIVAITAISFASFGQGYFNVTLPTRGVWDGFTIPGADKLAATMDVALYIGNSVSATPAAESILNGVATNSTASFASSPWQTILTDPNFTLATNVNTSTAIILAVQANGSASLAGSTPVAGSVVGNNAIYLVAWSSAYADPTAAAAANAAVGWSKVFTYSAVASIGTPGTFAAAGYTPFGVNSIAATPEPSTMALAALGGASLLLFRRRK